MDITQQPYKHLKLDKFVYGSKQKIIKTTTQVVNKNEDQIINYKSAVKNVYYFSDIDNYLINFHDINFDYINNKKKLTINSYIDNYNPTFSVSANIVKHYTTEQDGQRIAYFPQYIYTPLDIAQFKNSCYFLLPISTNKFVNIAHPNKILNDVQRFLTSPVPKDLSSNIAPHMQFYDRAAYTSEDNCIPVYDMNFKQLQTIKFNSTNELYVWLLKWGLQSIIYQDEEGLYHSLINEIMFDSTKNMSFEDLVANNLSVDGCDSVKVEPFVKFLLDKNYLYSRQTMNKMLSQLFANLATSSMQRYFRLAGRINKLNDSIKYMSGNVFQVISGELQQEGIYNTRDLLNTKQDVNFAPQVLPQNTLLVDNTLYSLTYDSQKQIREYFPSCYINFVNLKNNRDPQYQLNCTINNGTVDESNQIFLTDGRFSIEYNNINSSSSYLSCMNEQMTNEIVDKAIEYDKALGTNEGYVNLFPQRMDVKKRHYLNQYNDRHLCNNVLSSMGTLDGIRNYLHVGTSFNKTVWLSYSYNQQYNNDVFINIVNGIDTSKLYTLEGKVYSLPFYGYVLNRDGQWLKDYNGNNKTTCLMKSQGIECPWRPQIQHGILCCSLGLMDSCTGFCTFPCNGQIKQSTNNNIGLNWKLNQYYNLHKGLEDVRAKMNNGLRLTNNNQWCIIPSSNYNQLIVANDDININDDLQVFITSAILDTNAQFSNVISKITSQMELKSIFQGFWDNGTKEEYRYVDSKNEIAQNSKFNGPHIITKDTIISGISIQSPSSSFNYIPSGCYCLMRVKSWWSDTVRCEGSLKIIQDIKEDNSSINNYDFIQTIDGFFKFQQTGLHKSNIYSINLKNTGLGKNDDKQVKYYTKPEVIKLLEQKYFLRYYQDEDSFLVNSNENTFIHAVFGSEWNTTFKRTPLFKKLQKEDENEKLMSGFILNYITVPFETLIQHEGMKTMLNDSFEQVYYYQKELQKAQEYNSVRQNIRQLIQKAIRKSITRYMPADTNLWKVEYQDEN